MPADCQDKPVYTDYLGAYARFFVEEQHHPCKREDDLIERFFLLVEEHNQQAARRWNHQQSQASIATLSSPQPQPAMDLAALSRS